MAPSPPPPISRPWPVALAPLGAIVLPVATVRHTESMRLWQAAIVHLVGAALTLAAVAALLAWASSDNLLSVAAWRAELDVLLTDLGRGLTRLPIAASLMSMAVATEAGVIVVGWWLMAWGARDELVPAAFKASLIRVWCVTPHVALLVVLFGLGTVPLERAYDAAMQDYTLHNDPWYARHAMKLIGLVWTALGIWALALLLRVGMAYAWNARCRWPPVCDRCGYTLLGVDRDGACPECGLSIEASLGDEARPGMIGQTWRQNINQSMLHPEQFGRRLRALHPEGAHRRLLLINATIIGLLSAFGALGLAGMTRGVHWLALNEALGVGVFAAVGTLALSLAMASLVGSMVTRMTHFPLMHVACQSACALTGLVMVWVAGNWIIAAGMVILDDMLPSTGAAAGWINIAVIVGNTAMLVLYMLLLWRITMAARFANW